MRAAIALAFVSAVGVCVAVALPGWSDLIMLAGPCLAASIVLLVRAILRLRVAEDQVILDGSNVMYWNDSTPSLETLREVLNLVRARGLTPGIMFDANAGYLLTDRYRHDGYLARQLNLPPDRVMVVPKDTPADPMILTAARDLGARVVTNDRFRDWAQAYPEVRRPGHLIRGGYRGGKLWLEEAPAVAGTA